MRRTLAITLGFLLLFAAEILRVYFIMPFPGSQQSNSIQIAFFLNKYMIWFRILGLLLVLPPAFYYFRRSGLWKKALLSTLILFYGLVFYMFNFRFLADKMFYQPRNKSLVPVSANKVDTNQLVIGAVINDQARAYPIQIIGYHHQVQDTAGGVPIMVTYCTVCRTGRIFSPIIDNKFQHFRLVGMDHFNAMFEDEATRSWWRQENGEAVAGALRGTKLEELPSAQMRLGAWIREHSGTLILQPDTIYKKQYAGLQGYDSGTIEGSLEKRDSSSWKSKSWVVGISYNGHAKAYDWNDLVQKGIINDSFAGAPVLLVLENDSTSFHTWDRTVHGQVLHFEPDRSLKLFRDSNTNSLWSWSGVSTDGPLKGAQLKPIQSYQEFWHSWQSFHPSTVQYR